MKQTLSPPYIILPLTYILQFLTEGLKYIQKNSSSLNLLLLDEKAGKVGET